MRWHLSHRFDPRALPLADRHYNRRKPGTPQFAAPGRTLALLTERADALWVSTWPYEHLAWHEWAGAWVNTLFRNESKTRASDLIRDAVAATAWKWPTPARAYPMVTFINARKVRAKRDPGYCYLMAGWERIGTTAGGLIVLGCPIREITDITPPLGAQLEMVTV